MASKCFASFLLISLLFCAKFDILEEITVESIVRGVKIYHISTCESTQNLAKIIVRSKSMSLENACIYTYNQTKGIGQFTNTWSSEPNKNLLFTLGIEIRNSDIDLVKLNKAIAGLSASILQELTNESVFIKWPNDIVLRDKKLGGLLMEIQTFDNQRCLFVGIGLNFLQTYWIEPSINGTGFSEFMNKKHTLDSFKEFILNSFIEKVNLIVENSEFLHKYSLYYGEHLYKLNQEISLKKDNEIISGLLKGVDQYGRVVVLHNSELESFHHGEVRIIL